jgi:hypothetical protein
LGEKWTVGIETNGDTVLVTATVINVSSTTLFGKFTTVKSIRIVEENMPPRKPFSLGTNYLADGFGLIRTDPEPGNIYSLTGAFLGGREYGIVLSVIDPHLLPNNIQLNQNFPNPFNPSTTFSFSLPSKSFVTLKIFNLLGREVATVVSEEVAVGSYSRIWNASGMPSGVYFYRLQAGTYTETKHMLLLK